MVCIKQAGRDRLEAIFVDLELPQPEALAVQIHTRVPGATSSAQSFGIPDNMTHALKAALVLAGLR